MRYIAIVLLAFWTVAASAASYIAVWSPESSSGLELIQWADGQWQTQAVEGRQAVRLREGTTPVSSYLYFRVSPEARQKILAGAWLIVDFMDEGVGTVGVEFNTEDSPYTLGRGFAVVGTGRWQRALISLAGARFRGAQNGGTDFRLVCQGSPAISRVELYSEQPDVKLPTDIDRIREATQKMGKTAGPKDMFYTFGNDITETTGPVYKSLGVTSIESYVTWETCERESEGKWDWSRWDDQVRLLKENDLKWVPFLILGPAYSTPNWFRASDQHFPCRCLEHGTDSKIESLWNPNLPKWIERFIREFANRYRDQGVIESVLLGIQGDFGEAIYSVWGGGWTFDIPGEYHNHAGYWCDDPYALSSYRDFIRARYKSVGALNKAWGTSIQSLDEVDFPGRKGELDAFQERVKAGEPGARRQWLDFVEWYRDSMTRWADWWIAVTRKYFPDTPIYLCTGGDAEPRHGSNFAEQCRVAAKHKAGVRITNEASNYATNFVITRWVASAGKHYGAYYGFEPAGAEDEFGIVARIYNATASGANQLHDYSPNVTQSRSRIEQQQKHIKYLFRVPTPIVPVALWYPNVAMTLRWGGYLEKAAKLRDLTDYDYVDETMLRTGALSRYRVMVIIHGDVMETSDARLVADWVAKGGRLVVMDVSEFESVEGTRDPEKLLFGDNALGRIMGKGSVVRVAGWDALAQRLGETLVELGLPLYDLKMDGVYGTQIAADRFLYLSAASSDSEVEISYKGRKVRKPVTAGTITEIRL